MRTRRTIIRKSRKHGHWMAYHATGYSTPHESFADAIDAACSELRRYAMATSHVWRKVEQRAPVIPPPVKKTTQHQRRKDRVRQRDGSRCHYCPGRGTTLDHVVPQSKGGPNLLGNWKLACNRCNGDKGDTRGTCLCSFCNAAWQSWGGTLF